jgi:hypothetical protein
VVERRGAPARAPAGGAGGAKPPGERIERRVTNLELLPARVDSLTSQILHLRTEMRAEFSAVRGEMAAQGAALRQEIAGQGSDLRRDIDGLATQMRVLHEEVIARIALLHEAPRGPSRRREK